MPEIIYAACWQDPSEPWGWETDSVYKSREGAERRLQDMIQESADSSMEYDASKRKRWKKEMALLDSDPEPEPPPSTDALRMTDAGELVPLFPKTIVHRRPRPDPPSPLKMEDALKDAARYHCVQEFEVFP